MAPPERGRRTAEQARAAVLAAAEAEFAAHGRAGARIDRIAAAAGASKERLYAYFTDKDDLFNQVVDTVLTRVATAVPLAADDLGRYVGELVTWFQAHPAEVRLAFWMQLDGVAGAHRGHGVEHRHHDARAKVEAVAAAQSAGSVDDSWDPAELLRLLLGLALHWALSPDGTQTDPTRLTAEERHRQRVVAEKAARRLTGPRGLPRDDGPG